MSSKLVRRWVIEILFENGPSTCNGIIQKLKHRRACPSQHQLANYLRKWPETETIGKTKPTIESGEVSVWGLVQWSK